MTTQFDKVLREYASSEAGLTLAAGQWGQAQDTGRAKLMRRDGVTFDWVETASRLAGQTTVLGLALIGMSGITGITPNGGSSGAAATAANMLIGMRDSMILKSPYNSTINTIQPTADYVPLNIKGFAAGVSNLLTLQTSAATVAWFDNSANLTLSRSDSGNSVQTSIINSSNTSSSNAVAMLSVGGGSAGNPYLRWNVNGAQDWSMGIRTSSNPSFELQIGAENGVTLANAFLRMGVNGSRYAIFTAPVTATSFTCASDSVFAGASFSSAVTMATTLGVTGIASHAAAITFTGNGTAATGSILKTAADGLLLRGITGSSNDFGLYGNGGTLILSNPTGTNNITLPGGDLTISRSNVGGNVLATISNTDNTNAASHAKILLQVQGASGGNPYINFLVNGVTNWSIGADNVASGDPFKISQASTLGTTDVLIINTAGKVSVFGGTFHSNCFAEFDGVAGSVSTSGGTTNARMGWNNGSDFILQTQGNRCFTITASTGAITTGSSLICGGGSGTIFQLPTLSSGSITASGSNKGAMYFDSVSGHIFANISGSVWVQVV